MLGRFLESNPGWEENWTLRLDSAQFQVKLPAGAELGNDGSEPGFAKGMGYTCILLDYYY